MINVSPFVPVLMTAEADVLLSIIQSIADQGVMIVITSIVVIFLGKYLKIVMDRETELINGILPKLDELNNSIKDLQKTFNEAIGSHNTRSNQSLRTLERDSSDIKNYISDNEDLLREIDQKMTILENNYNTLFKVMVSFMNNNKPGLFSSHDYDDEVIIDPNKKDEREE